MHLPSGIELAWGKRAAPTNGEIWKGVSTFKTAMSFVKVSLKFKNKWIFNMISGDDWNFVKVKYIEIRFTKVFFYQINYVNINWGYLFSIMLYRHLQCTEGYSVHWR